MGWLFRFWRRRPGAFVAEMEFKGELQMKVIRKNPTRWRRLIDFLRGH